MHGWLPWCQRGSHNTPNSLGKGGGCAIKAEGVCSLVLPGGLWGGGYLNICEPKCLC